MKLPLPRSPFSTRLSGSAKETERRIRNIFQGPKKRPHVWLIALAAAAILSCGGLASCQAGTGNLPNESQAPEDVSTPPVEAAPPEQETLSPARRAQKFLTEADGVYSSVTLELYGETVPVLVRALDGDGSNSIGLDHTISLEMLKNADLSEYREIESLEDAEIPSDMPFSRVLYRNRRGKMSHHVDP